jgi:hypothetical protein
MPLHAGHQLGRAGTCEKGGRRVYETVSNYSLRVQTCIVFVRPETPSQSVLQTAAEQDRRMHLLAEFLVLEVVKQAAPREVLAATRPVRPDQPRKHPNEIATLHVGTAAREECIPSVPRRLPELHPFLDATAMMLLHGDGAASLPARLHVSGCHSCTRTRPSESCLGQSYLGTTNGQRLLQVRRRYQDTLYLSCPSLCHVRGQLCFHEHSLPSRRQPSMWRGHHTHGPNAFGRGERREPTHAIRREYVRSSRPRRLRAQHALRRRREGALALALPAARQHNQILRLRMKRTHVVEREDRTLRERRLARLLRVERLSSISPAPPLSRSVAHLCVYGVSKEGEGGGRGAPWPRRSVSECTPSAAYTPHALTPSAPQTKARCRTSSIGGMTVVCERDACATRDDYTLTPMAPPRILVLHGCVRAGVGVGGRAEGRAGTRRARRSSASACVRPAQRGSEAYFSGLDGRDPQDRWQGR